MTRFTLSRSEIRAEVGRRKAGVTPEQSPTPVPASSPSKRWSAKMFMASVAVADALARLASRTIHGIVDEPRVGERHSMRRHRGVYIWRPAMDQPDPQITGELIDVRDSKRVDSDLQKHNQAPPH